jgi:hypothetical protein
MTVRDHRFGGREFRLGAREVGHLHGDRQADIAYPRPVRDAVVGGGLAGPHHLFPDSGWVTYRVDGAAEGGGHGATGEGAGHGATGEGAGHGAADRIVDLLRLSYLVHAAALGRREDHPELAALDVLAELESLGLDPDVTAAVRARVA